MRRIIEEIKNLLSDNCFEAVLISHQLRTCIKCYTSLYCSQMAEFSEVLNKTFECNEIPENKLETYILEDDSLFSKVFGKLEDTTLTQTNAVKKFNESTVSTSLARCSEDRNYYIMRCYDYFIYIFDKINRQCYMIIKNNNKAITMINILLFSPYLMYGELFAVHGGLVSKGDKNILISNSSLGGKTTFAILFAAHDWNIVTEETTYITKKGVILPYNVRNYFNIRVGTYLAFKDYFASRNVINEKFLKMEHLDNNQLFDYGKESQLSVDFAILGKNMNVENRYISHFLKVSIQKNQDMDIKRCSPLGSVNAFLELSLAPTVLLFEELLDYKITDKDYRKKELEIIFEHIDSFMLTSGLDYKVEFNNILKNMEIH